MNILIIQGVGNKGLPSGEDIMIKKDRLYLKKKHNVHVEYIDKKFGLFGKAFGLVWPFGDFKKIILLLDKHKPDLIHFHTIVPHLSILVLYAARKRNVRIVQTLHNMRWLCVEGGFYRNNTYCDDCVGGYGFLGVKRGCNHGRIISFYLFVSNYIMRRFGFLFRYVDCFIAVSDFVKRTHVQSQFPQRIISVRNNSIDLINIDQATVREGVTFAGRVSIAKGALLIEQIIPNVKEKINIVGNGPYLEDLKLFCAQNNFKNVIFWGKQTHAKTVEIIQTSICTVVPSQCGETFSLVAAESMAAGVPVVASNLGGVADLVNQSGGGLVVNHSDYKAFSDSINMLLYDIKKADVLGSKGISYAVKYLSHERQGEILIDIYNAVIEEYKNKER